MLFHNGSSYDVVPSEGSHADFAPRGETQRALQAFCEATLGECEIEQVCCGSGIQRIYDFCGFTGARRPSRTWTPRA